MRRTAVAAAFALALVAAIAAPRGSAQASCSSSFTSAIVGGEPKCLRAGEFCSPGEEADYRRYGFTCVAGRLHSGGTPAAAPATGSAAPSVVQIGTTVLLGSRTLHAGCRRSALPDRRCSPGAYYAGLTSSVICSATFHTSTIRNVPQSEKYDVEREYGMAARLYGHTIEIDHIVPLELGGSNDIANLYPEPGSGHASYHAKDKLENKVHALVCAGSMTLAAARRGIATDWEALYAQVYGAPPA